MAKVTDEITTIENNLVEWYNDYQENHPHTHSGTAMRETVESLIKSGVTTAACGALDGSNAHLLRALICNPAALNIVARMQYWGDTRDEAETKKHGLNGSCSNTEDDYPAWFVLTFSRLHNWTSEDYARAGDMIDDLESLRETASKYHLPRSDHHRDDC